MKIFIIAVGFFLLSQGLVAANVPMGDKAVHQNEKGAVTNEKESKECDCEQREHTHRDWQEKMEERERDLLARVDQFTPDKKEEWSKVLEEKKALHNEWMSPKFAKNREKWKLEKREKMQELKKQLHEGKITKEEFVKKLHGGKYIWHWKTFHDLEIAVEAKDDKQATTLLNQMLDQYKQHNQKMKERINSTRLE